ncbi:DUF2599 domain-containing protein [Pseudomonas sp. SDO524_S393]
MKRVCIYFIFLFHVFLTNLAAAQYLNHDQVGAQTVFDMYAAYKKTVADCGSAKRPAFLCSGIFIRGTVYSAEYRFWNFGPASKEATAFSYIRKDAKFRQLASDHRHGYIIRSMFYSPDDYIQLQVLCAAVNDAGSHGRVTEKGCGDAVNTEQVERSCQAQGITTADAWLAYYLVNGKSHYRQCLFDLKPATEPASANIFMQFIKAHSFAEVQSEHFAADLLSNNEIRIASWPQSDGSRVPIWAIFWISKDTVTGAATEAGKSEAQKDQMAIYEDSGHFLPIVRITLPMTPAEDATFFYAPADQAPLNTVMCRRFVDKTEWVNRYDPGAKANKWTLSVTPTDCGRLSQANQLDNFYKEIVDKHGKDPQWVAEYNGGVRRQLACLLATYRDNTNYNLEPFRSDTTQAVAVAAGCNPS